MTLVLLVTEVATEKQQGSKGQSEWAVGNLHTTTIPFSLCRDVEISTPTLPNRSRRYRYGRDPLLFQIKIDKCTHILLTPLY
jgi:hypothetical protein